MFSSRQASNDKTLLPRLFNSFSRTNQRFSPRSENDTKKEKCCPGVSKSGEVMQRRQRKELLELDAIFEELRKDAKTVAEDLAVGIDATKTVGVFSILIGVLAAVMVYPTIRIEPLGVYIGLVFAAFAGGMIVLGAFTLRSYKVLAQKYSKLLKLKRSER
jgi:hypothetical protein